MLTLLSHSLSQTLYLTHTHIVIHSFHSVSRTHLSLSLTHTPHALAHSHLTPHTSHLTPHTLKHSHTHTLTQTLSISHTHTHIFIHSFHPVSHSSHTLFSLSHTQTHTHKLFDTRWCLCFNFVKNEKMKVIEWKQTCTWVEVSRVNTITVKLTNQKYLVM